MFDQLYYWMYFYLNKQKKSFDPAFRVYLLMSGLIAFNIGTIAFIVSYPLNYKPNMGKNMSLLTGIATSAVLFTINYFLLYSRREVIFKKYGSTPSGQKIRGQVYFWLYVILSVVMFCVAAENFKPQPSN